MAYYHEGYNEALRQTLNMSLPELLDLCDDLYGRRNIENQGDIEEVRAEALRQLAEEWTDKDSREFKQVEFWKKVHKAGGV